MTSERFRQIMVEEGYVDLEVDYLLGELNGGIPDDEDFVRHAARIMAPAIAPIRARIDIEQLRPHIKSV